MREQVVGLFKEAGSAVEAARLIRVAGYGVRDVDMVSRDVLPSPVWRPKSDVLGQVGSWRDPTVHGPVLSGGPWWAPALLKCRC